MHKLVIASLGIVIIASSIGLWLYINNGESLNNSAANIDTSKIAESTDKLTTPDGTWTTKEHAGVFVGYEIKELFGGETVKKTAAGKTKLVKGSFGIKGGTLTQGVLTADMTSLQSDESRRDNS